MQLRRSSLLRFFVLAFGALCLCAAAVRAEAAVTFGLNDLSVLIPLPHSEEEAEAMLRPASPAKGGPLLAPKILTRLPSLVVGGEPGEQIDSLRVIAIRFDPCFREGDEPCRRQIRLVLQPLGIFRRAYSTTDAAVHLFFDFSPAEWQAVMNDWARTAVGTKADALAVHPRLSAEGLLGPHWAKLRALVLKHCGPKNLTRFTVSNVNLFGTLWAFVGHNIGANGAITPIEIPRLPTAGQAFAGDLGNLQEFFGEVFPKPEGDPELNKIWTHSVGAKNTMPPEAIAKALARVIAFENPRQFHPGNVDCVSCHLAQNTRLWGERSFPEWFKSGPWVSMFQKDEFRSGWNLTNTTARFGFTNRVRAFGYFVDEPVISQRVINETAAVAEEIEAAAPKVLR